MKKLGMAQFLGLSLIIDIILLDQLTKWAAMELILRPAHSGDSIGLIDWIMHAPERLPLITVPVMPSFNWIMVWNPGVSFGMFQGHATIWPLVVITVAISAVFMVWLLKSNSKFESAALAMVIGGALGNLVDRFRFGAVADFIDLYIGDWHFPAFNLADSAITIGVAMLIIHGLFLNKKDS